MKHEKFVSFAHSVAQEVLKHPELSHGAVRVGVWLSAVADLQGSAVVEIFQTDIIRGYDTDKFSVHGITMRPGTVRAAIESLEALGIISVHTGETRIRAGNPRTCYTLLGGYSD